MSALLFSILFSILYYTDTHHKPQCGRIYITEGAFSDTLILNWDFNCDPPPSVIKLTETDPSKHPHGKVLLEVKTDSRCGYHITNFTAKDKKLPGNWSDAYHYPNFDDNCFPFYISSYRNDILVDYNCFGIHPCWMKKLKLNAMMIPGTHNSGAFNSPFPKMINCWINCQNRNFWEQLVFGIRFLDIRVGIVQWTDPTEEGYYIFHGVCPCTELIPELHSVAIFLDKSPTEIVILDFHEFLSPEHFSEKCHRKVINLIHNIFGSKLFPYYKSKSSTLTVEDCVNSGQQIIISYNWKCYHKYPWLWPEIKRFWPDETCIKRLRTYIERRTERNQLKHCGNPFTVLMAELTPSGKYIATHLLDSLKYLADVVNAELHGWMRNQYRFMNVNIIATDFFTGNDMIEIALEANDRRTYDFTVPDINICSPTETCQFPANS